MTDRELLVLAAQAAGIADGDVFYDMESIREWNPLTDDGDALRLAVKVKATVFQADKSVIAELDSECDDPPIHKKEYCDDEMRCTATRRAIVRAAAEIGKAMK